MSKNKQYNNFYKSHAKEESPNEEAKEVQAVEGTAEVLQEETQTEEEKVEAVQEPIRQFAIVSGAKRVNMRKAPNKDAAVLKVLDENTEVELLEVDRTWAQIGYQGDIGYMMTMYLKPEN